MLIYQEWKAALEKLTLEQITYAVELIRTGSTKFTDFSPNPIQFKKLAQGKSTAVYIANSHEEKRNMNFKGLESLADIKKTLRLSPFTTQDLEQLVKEGRTILTDEQIGVLVERSGGKVSHGSGSDKSLDRS